MFKLFSKRKHFSHEVDSSACQYVQSTSLFSFAFYVQAESLFAKEGYSMTFSAFCGGEAIKSQPNQMSSSE